MARLRIELYRPEAKFLGTEIKPGDVELERQEYTGLLPDETVSSWADRHRFVRLTSDDIEERSFGTLIVDLPAASGSLLNDLRRAAKPPDAWMLRPRCRTLCCPRCLAEDWVQGKQPYIRRAWAEAWRTCCPRHGMLFDAAVEVPMWPSVLMDTLWQSDRIRIISRGRSAVLSIALHGDRRAVHLEGALAEGKHRSAWFPQGLDGTSLRTIYQAIVIKLLEQFSMTLCGKSEERPAAEFNRELITNRFAVNALAEAILSKWTNTPLPDSASAQRTNLLVRAIGWGEERPISLRRGQVLFPGPYERPFFEFTPFESLLRLSQYQKLSNPTKLVRQGYFTLAEARQLDLDIDDSVGWLVRLTLKGQFLAFDTRAGCLTENPALPSVCRLQPCDVHPYKLLLPAWVFGPPQPDIKLRWRKGQPRCGSGSRRVVRFQHSTQTNDDSFRS